MIRDKKHVQEPANVINLKRYKSISRSLNSFTVNVINFVKVSRCGIKWNSTTKHTHTISKAVVDLLRFDLLKQHTWLLVFTMQFNFFSMLWCVRKKSEAKRHQITFSTLNRSLSNRAEKKLMFAHRNNRLINFYFNRDMFLKKSKLCHSSVIIAVIFSRVQKSKWVSDTLEKRR